MAGPTVLSLFSGVGGLDIAIKLVWPGARILGYCERDACAAGILLARMEDEALELAPVWCGDIQDMDASGLRGRVDIVCGGFPCQDISVAGKGGGLSGKRSGLFYELMRVVREVGPQFIFLENVSAITNRGLDAVLGEMAQSGFDAEWLCLRASNVGASHKRERWFCLAHSHGERPERQECDEEVGRPRPGVGGEGMADTDGRCELANAEDDHRGSGERGAEAGARQDGERGRGSAGGCEQLADTIGRRRDGRSPDPWWEAEWGDAAAGSGAAVADASGEQHQRRRDAGDIRCEAKVAADDSKQRERLWVDAPRGSRPFPPGPGERFEWQRVLDQHPHLAPATQPGVRVLVNGVALVVDASRADQLRCCGNGVVPLQAAAALVELVRRMSVAEACHEAMLEIVSE